MMVVMYVYIYTLYESNVSVSILSIEKFVIMSVCNDCAKFFLRELSLVSVVIASERLFCVCSKRSPFSPLVMMSVFPKMLLQATAHLASPASRST